MVGEPQYPVRSSLEVVFRDYPLTFWVFGALFLFVGAVVFIGPDAQGRALMLLGAALFIALPSILTVTADRTRGMIHFRYRSLIRVSTKSYPSNEIAFVNVAQDREGERMYRLEVVLMSGDVFPLRSFYSVGKKHYERRAQQLRSALQVGGEVSEPRSSIRITISKS
jgi:hypothetical protein